MKEGGSFSPGEGSITKTHAGQRAGRAGLVKGGPCGPIASGERPAAFDAAMDDDLAVSSAFAVLHETVRQGNTALGEGDVDAVRSAAGSVLAMLDVLGLNPNAEPWNAVVGNDRADDVIDALVQVLLAQRQDARARKDFAAADAIRDGLDAIGIRIEDTPQGARWSLED